MYYLIRSLTPLTHVSIGAHAFCIDLHENWRSLVKRSGMTQEKADTHLAVMGRQWLTACGFKKIFEVGHDLRIGWGEWGVEHITVPGNACGLDIEKDGFGTFTGGAQLVPHNVDSWQQKQLLLIVFCALAEDVVLFADVRKDELTAT